MAHHPPGGEARLKAIIFFALSIISKINSYLHIFIFYIRLGIGKVKIGILQKLIVNKIIYIFHNNWVRCQK